MDVPNIEFETQPLTFMDKIKSSFKWLYNTLFSYDTLIIMLIVGIILLIITVYNIYKNKVLSIELKDRLNRVEDNIKQTFLDIYIYIKNIIYNIYKTLKDLILGNKKEIEQDIQQDINALVKKEVFNISQNKFTYEEAEGVCKAYDSEVASKEQIELALENGANWCNYGWSKDGLALYPIQEGYYKKLKESSSGKRNQCGYPGVNGGKLNPNLKLGVNCFGIKPTKNIETVKECSVDTSSIKKIDTDALFINKFNCANDSEYN